MFTDDGCFPRNSIIDCCNNRVEDNPQTMKENNCQGQISVSVSVEIVSERLIDTHSLETRLNEQPIPTIFRV